MPDPAVTQVMQIGIVVPDLDAAIRAWEARLGVGPWNVFTLDPEDGSDVRVNGEPAEWTARAATAMVGQVMLELIEPVREDDLFGTFLAEHGPGVHHIAMRATDYDGLTASFGAAGEELVLSGEWSGVHVAYLPTRRELGVLLEVFKGYD